jgi:hypothetical protein
LYARARIREFWVVDLTTRGVLAHRGPGGGSYDVMTKIEPPGVLEVADLPGVRIPAAALFI